MTNTNVEPPPLYKGKLIRFDCLKCGHCCRTLIKENDGIITGLTLGLNEIKYFPKEVLVPRMGRGKDKKNISKITRFQLITNICPNLDENKCTIYENRPLLCKRFPLMSSTGLLANIACGTDCKFIEKIESELKYELNFIFSSDTFRDKECWDALQTEICYKEIDEIDAHIEGMNIFQFNLKTNKWEDV